MMEGINAAGKRVSLLNDDRPAPTSTASLPYHPKEPKASLPRPSLACDSRSSASVAAPRPSYSSRSSTSGTSSSTSSNNTTAASTTSSHHLSSNSHNTYHSDSDSFVSSSSRHSSVASPLYSPSARAVPSLLRHDSSSSSQSMNIPSPMTPTYPYAAEPLDPKDKAAINIDPSYSFASHQLAAAAAAAAAAASTTNGSMLSASGQQRYYPSPAQGSQAAMYAGFPAMQAQPGFDDSYSLAAVAPQMQFQYPTDLISPVGVQSLNGPLASPNGLSGVATGANPGAADPGAPATNGSSSAPGSATKPAKKKYPCPHAARFGCTDTFTTSGHAARHGKKHTGEKNILCPTCNKAFTRKDNMKQHERTHKTRHSDSVDHGKPTNVQSGHSRRTQSISSVAASTVTQKSSNSIDMDLDSPILDGVDSKRGSLQRPPLDRSAQYTGYRLGNEAKLELPSRPELNRQFSGESQDGEGESPGLDALAMVASELR